MRDKDLAPPLERRRKQAARAERRRHFVIAVLAAAAIAFVVGVAAGSSADDAAPTEGESAGPPELPRGGRSLLPEHRLVGFYGAPQDDALGALGIGTPSEA